MNRIPLELLTRVFDPAVDHGAEEHPNQIIPLTHVCRYWRMILLSYPGMWSMVSMQPGDPSVISEWLVRSQKVTLTITAEFADSYEHPGTKTSPVHIGYLPTRPRLFPLSVAS